MKAALGGGKWQTRMRTTGQVVDTYEAADLWNMIAESAWACADPGVQYECQISDVRYPDTPMQEETVIPNCADAGGKLPCYDLQPNLEQCANTATNMELIIQRDGEPPTGTHVQARCVVL